MKAELYYGAYKSSRCNENLALLTQFFGAFVTVPFDRIAEEIYGQIRAELTRQGNPGGPNDLLIGATALAHKLVLVTHNVREFRRLPNLQIEDWEEESIKAQ